MEPFRPTSAFNFRIELDVPGVTKQVCSAEFAECDGLEISMQPRTIRAGGLNGQQIHLMGPVSYGQLTLRRGMTNNADLWQWFDLMQQKGRQGIRANGSVVMLAPDGKGTQATFVLTRCLPVKLKGPALNAKDGQVAIEELQLVYETLRFQPPQANPPGR
ncbi:MAG: phage tail protein [Mycobacterium leprae]